MNQQQKTFEDSLKSIETENFFDRIFYRPIGYRLALLLSKTNITPNTITIISIFVGVLGGVLLFPHNIIVNLLGFLVLVCANILDCVDGQLARLTGVKSEVGRILDGLAGDFWFVSIYLAIVFRLSLDIGAGYAWLIVIVASASNIVQSNIVDYYKTAHLYFISLQKGAEFDTIERVRAKHKTMKGVNRLLYRLYIYYTLLQIKITPQLQKMLLRLKNKYGDDYPEDVRIRLRHDSSRVMPLLNFPTFNGRSGALLLAILCQQIWVYLAFEIVVLNIILFVAIRKHESNCKEFDI